MGNAGLRRSGVLGLLLVPLLGACASAATAFTPRAAHTSTLLPDGSILIVGGNTNPFTTAGACGSAADADYLTGATSIQVLSSGTFTNAGPMPSDNASTSGVARASHTATLLPNGLVLIAGGVNERSCGIPGALLYDPRTYSKTAVAAAFAGGGNQQRFGHTATLLKNGTVLICGGQEDPSSPAFPLACQLYRPAGVAGCAAGGTGCFSTPASLTTGRQGHTATLLPDGRVLIAGGWNGTGYLVSTELYTPAGNTTGSMVPGPPLIAKRAYHTATLLGNKKVAIVGGFNGLDAKANKGILETVELFDPVAGSFTQGGKLQARKQMHSATLGPDGTLNLYGGLGNITTSFFKVSEKTLAASFSGTASGTPGLIDIDSALLAMDLKFPLSSPVTGEVQNGVVLFSSPQIHYELGLVNFPYGTDPPQAGLFLDLDSPIFGSPVRPTCDPVCGTVTMNPAVLLFFFAPAGSFFTVDRFSPDLADMTLTSQGGSCALNNEIVFDMANCAAGTHCLSTDPSLPITGGRLEGTLTITVPGAFVGATVLDLSITDLAGSIQGAFYTVQIQDSSSFTDCDPGVDPVVAPDGNGQGVFTKNVQFAGLTGTVSSGSDSTGICSPLPNAVAACVNSATPGADQPNDLPNNLLGRILGGPSASMVFTPNGVTLDGETFDADVATVIIKGMVFSDLETYSPQSDSWNFTVQAPVDGAESLGHSATLTPGGNLALLGGVSHPFTTLHDRHSIIPKLGPWSDLGALQNPRLNHTSTLLPDGSILVAGGSNGPNVLRQAELLDPVSGETAATGDMITARDLHGAVLLLDGRVLVAGGFATTALSTGATAAAEVYDPRLGVWYPAGSMARARSGHAMLLLSDGNVMATGGYNETDGYLDSVEIYYSTKDAWTELPGVNIGDLVTARALHSATLLQDGRVLVCGGVNSLGNVTGNCELMTFTSVGWEDVAADNFPNSKVLHSHRATLLFDGRVLVTGGNDGFGQTDSSLIWDPRDTAGGDWLDMSDPAEFTNNVPRPLNFKRFNHTATLLPNGNVLVAGGGLATGESLASVETFDVSATSWQITGALSAARSHFTATLAPDGSLVAAGGYSGALPLSGIESIHYAGTPHDSRSLGFPPSVRLSSITSVDYTPFQRGSFVTVRGQSLLGVTEASGGSSGPGHSSHHGPRMILQAMDGSGATGSQGQGGFALDISSLVHNNAAVLAASSLLDWTVYDTSITIRIPHTPTPTSPGPGDLRLAHGWYHLRAGANAQLSGSVLVRAGPALPVQAPAPVTLNVAAINSITWNYTVGAVSPAPEGFNVYSTSSGVRLSQEVPGTGTFVQTGLAPNTKTQISVSAFSQTGDGPLAEGPTVYSLAAVPAAVSIASVAASDLLLQWSVNGNTPGTVFEVEQSTDHPTANGNAPFATSISTPVPTALANTTNFALINGLAFNTTYSFRLRAYNGDGIPSAYSLVVTTQTRSTVSSLAGFALDATRIRWFWADAGATSYKIFSTSSTDKMGQVTSLFFDQVGLSTNTPHAVRVLASNPGGDGPLATAATVYTLAAVPGSVSPAFLNVSTGSYALAWSANQNPVGTNYEATVATATVSTHTTTALNISFSAETPSAAQVYAEVRGVNGDGLKSAPLILGTTFTLPNIPTALTVLGTTLDAIAVSWSSNNNSSSATYEVTFSTDDFTADVRTFVSFVAQSSVTSTVITPLQSGTTYSIRVRAQTPIGQRSAYSVPVTTATGTGGVAFGSLGGFLNHTINNTISGTIGNGPSLRQVELFAPAFSFTQDFFIIISTYVIPPSPCGSGSTGVGISITTIPPLQPVSPIFLTFSYSASDLFNQLGQPVSPGEAVFQRVDASGACVPVPTTFDTAQSEVTVQLNHLSLFNLGQIQASNTVETANAFPNPFIPTRGHGFVTIRNAPSGARVRIFTMRGEKLFEGYAGASGIMVWPGTNRAGRPVSSGVYLAVVEKDDDEKVLKLVVTR